MSELQQLQRDFLQRVVAPTAPPGAPGGLQAYRDAYLLRIDEALRTDFEAVHRILGDEQMLALSTDYIRAHPSEQPSIRWVGSKLADFIAASPYWSRVPLLAEVARFEWSKSCLFDATDSPVATLEQLQAIAPERWGGLRLSLVAAHRVVELAANAPPLAQQLVAGEDVDTPVREPDSPWLLWRKELVVHWRSLDALELAALAAVAGGASFAELCEELAEQVDEEQVPATAMQLLLQWCHDQLISDFHP